MRGFGLTRIPAHWDGNWLYTVCSTRVLYSLQLDVAEYEIEGRDDSGSEGSAEDSIGDGEDVDMFDADDMEAFVQQAERLAELEAQGRLNEDDEGSDDEDEDEDSNAGKDLRYEDFFSPPSAKMRGRRAQEEDEEEEEDKFDEDVEAADGDDDTLMTPFAQQQQALASKIAQLEESVVKRRNWSLMGEAGAKDRARNSALDVEVRLPSPSCALSLLTPFICISHPPSPHHHHAYTHRWSSTLPSSPCPWSQRR